MQRASKLSRQSVVSTMSQMVFDNVSLLGKSKLNIIVPI